MNEKMFLLLIAACLSVMPTMAEVTNVANAEQATDSSTVTTIQENNNMSHATCKNLHKVTNVDDLLKQMYDNIDSYCLFDMPTEELEKIWGLKIFDFSINVNSQNLREERRKYEKEFDGLYLVKKNFYKESLRVFTTDLFRENHKEVWGNSDLSRGKLSTIPLYDTKKAIVPMDHMTIISKEQYAELPDSDFEFMHNYYWLNSERSFDKPFLELSTGNVKKIPGIMFYRNAVDGDDWFQKILDSSK